MGSTCPQSLTKRLSPKRRLQRRQRPKSLQPPRRLRRRQKRPKNKCSDQRIKSKTSWCSYLLYSKKISDILKNDEKAQIHSILKNLLPSPIFNHVQLTKPPDLLE